MMWGQARAIEAFSVQSVVGELGQETLEALGKERLQQLLQVPTVNNRLPLPLPHTVRRHAAPRMQNAHSSSAVPWPNRASHQRARANVDVSAQWLWTQMVETLKAVEESDPQVSQRARCEFRGSR
jgi:hypothetical protein